MAITLETGTAELTGSPNTFDAFAGMDPDSIRNLWDNMFGSAENASDFYQSLEGGKSSSTPIWSETRTAAGAGTSITYTVDNEYANTAKRGEEYFLKPEDRERDIITSYKCSTDWVRFAHTITAAAEEKMGMKTEISKQAPLKLGRRMGRQKCEDMDMMFALKAEGENIMFAGSATGFTGLTTSSTVAFNDFILARTTLSRQCEPCQVSMTTDGGKKSMVKRFLFCSPSDSLVGLENELVNSNLIQSGDKRGPGNFAFSGGWLDIRGQIICERDVINAARNGPWGSPMNPQVALGRDMDAGVTGGEGPATSDTVELWGNYGNERSKLSEQSEPWRWFPGYAFRWSSTDTFNPATASTNTIGGAPKYVIIYNRFGSDAKKWGMYRYTTNDGVKLVCDQFLASSDGAGTGTDRGLTQVGNVQWNSDKNTNVHPEGSIVIPCTENGVPWGWSLVLGKHAAVRAYGARRNFREATIGEDPMIRNIFISSIFGQAPAKDGLGRQFGFLTLIHAISYADMVINPTTA